MEKLHHELWLTQAVNTCWVHWPPRFCASLAGRCRIPAHVIPDYLVMIIVFTLGLTAFALLVRSRLSVENPGKLQVLVEDYVGLLPHAARRLRRAQGPRYLPLVGSLFLLILISNLAGLVPGFMAPDVELERDGRLRDHGVGLLPHRRRARAGHRRYLKHFAVPPGTPVFLAPLMLIIEPISHLARVMSLSLRLFGNIFGEELVIMILAGLVPFVVPLPMMLLGLLTGTLQALIFVVLTMVYLGGAVAVEHDEEAHH